MGRQVRARVADEVLWGSVQTKEQKRHLLRFWVDTHANSRPIAPTFAPRSSVFAHGGFRVPEGSKLRLPLHPPSRPEA